MISVITCIHNQQPEYFKRCANSVFDQGPSLEWILIDDGSTSAFKQSYREVLDGISNSDKQTRWIELDRNVGLSQARNFGIAAASGDWVFVLDSDDELVPGALDNVMRAPDQASLIAFASEFGSPEQGFEQRKLEYWETLFKRYGLGLLDPFLWFDFYYHGIVARQALLLEIGGYREQLRVGEDQDILLRACEVAGKDSVLFIDELGYRYRENPHGVCATNWPEVERNYAWTMTEAARRRGARFTGCRLRGRRPVGNALVDEYEYLLGTRWVGWEDCREWA